MLLRRPNERLRRQRRQANLVFGEAGEVVQQRGMPVYAWLGVDDFIETGHTEPGRITTLTAVHVVTKRKNNLQQLLQLTASNQISRRFQYSWQQQAVAYLGFGKGGHGERAEREPITGVWGRIPQRGPGAEPLVRGSGGFALWSWNTFCFWMFNGNRNFAHFLKFGNIVEFCNSCWKMAKNAPFHIKSPVNNFHGRAKGGAWHKLIQHKMMHVRMIRYIILRMPTFKNVLIVLITTAMLLAHYQYGGGRVASDSK